MEIGNPVTPQITYCPLEDRRLEEVLDFCVQNFAPDDNTLRLLRNCQGGRPEERRVRISQYLRLPDRRVHHVAIDDATDRVVGVCLSHTILPRLANPIASLENTASEVSQLLDAYSSQLEGDYDIFKAFEVEKAHYIHIVAVDRRYRRQGILSELLLQYLQRARQAGCQAAVAIASSPYSRRAFAKLGFHQQRFLAYRESLLAARDKVDVSGCRPDHGCALMVRRL